MNNLNDDKINLEQLAGIKIEYTNLVDYLKELMFKKGILNSPSYAELSRKLGLHYSWIKDKKYTMDQGHFPKKETIDDLYNRLSERFSEQLSKSWSVIQTRFTSLYNLSFTMKIESLSDLTPNQKSTRRKFFDKIKDIIKQYFPSIRIFDRDISRLLLNRSKALMDTHLKGENKYRMLELSTLFSFIFKIRTLTKEELINKVRDIDNARSELLEQIKNDIENFIENFIFANPFDTKYVNDKHDIGAKYFKPEYDLTLNVWFELSKSKKKPLLLKIIQKSLSYDSFGRLKRGYRYSYNGLLNMEKELEKILPSEVYKRTQNFIAKYIKIRSLHPTELRNYHPSWYTKSTLKFHIVMLIIRDLGLDILNLEPIEPIAFKKTKIMESYTFERHHIYINDKFSIDVNRLVLVMHTNHYELEGKSNIVNGLIKHRINLTLDCPQYYKTNIKNYEDGWEEYLERRLYLIENGVENFIFKYFTDENGCNYIVDRFFKDIPKGKIENDIRIIIQEWVNKNRPAPIINSNIFKRLSHDTLNLFKTGFVKSKS